MQRAGGRPETADPGRPLPGTPGKARPATDPSAAGEIPAREPLPSPFG